MSLKKATEKLHAKYPSAAVVGGFTGYVVVREHTSLLRVFSRKTLGPRCPTRAQAVIAAARAI